MDSLTLLSGGTGTPKLIRGFQEAPFARGERLSVVTNTGDDLVASGNLLCPDLDTVLYTLSDRLDRGNWYGVRDDTLAVHRELTRLGDSLDPVGGIPIARNPVLEDWPVAGALDEYMRIGDRDRALHMARTELLRQGRTLTEATRLLAEALGVEARILPMADDPVPTFVRTGDGRSLHFQEFWVREGGTPEVEGVEYRRCDRVPPTDAVREALGNPVVIGPSNPITSIGPILALRGVREALEQTTVVAVSPFRAGEAFSGPAAALMDAEGYEPSPRGLLQKYDFLDGIVVDERDTTRTPCERIRTDLWMENREDRVRVARAVLRVLSSCRDCSREDER